MDTRNKKRSLIYTTMLRQFVDKHRTSSSIILFIVAVMVIQAARPQFLCNIDGSYKTFGLGYRNKTVVPMWLVIILIAILSYTVILYITSRTLHY